MFQFSRAYKAYDTAYGLKEEDQILEKDLFSYLFCSGLSIDESYEALFKPEWKEEWKRKLSPGRNRCQTGNKCEKLKPCGETGS